MSGEKNEETVTQRERDRESLGIRETHRDKKRHTESLGLLGQKMKTKKKNKNQNLLSSRPTAFLFSVSGRITCVVYDIRIGQRCY